jgi:hypothetical protein
MKWGLNLFWDASAQRVSGADNRKIPFWISHGQSFLVVLKGLRQAGYTAHIKQELPVIRSWFAQDFKILRTPENEEVHQQRVNKTDRKKLLWQPKSCVKEN